VTTYLDPGVTIQTPQTLAGLNLAAGGNPLTTTLYSAAGPESQPDSYLGAGASLRWPKYGNEVALVNKGGVNRNVNALTQTMTIAAGDVDPTDGNVHVRFVVAPVLQNPAHTPQQQPYYFVQLTNITRSSILYVDYNASAQPGVPWKISNGVYYTDWQLVDISPGSANLAVGDQVELEVIGSGCAAGGHYGQVYVDGLGPTVPGAFVSATSVAAANAGTDITYTMTFQNGGTAAVAGTSIDFNTPASTYFESVTAPGLSCTTPTVGSAGLVTCVVGVLPAGSSGSFQVSVLIDPAATGILTEGNYSIYGTGVSPLLGPKVYTTVTSGITYADLALTLSDSLTGVTWGEPVSYTIVATNGGPNDVVGATVIDVFPATLTGVSWTCLGTGGASCLSGGVGNIGDATVAIPVGGSVTYTVSSSVVSGTGSAQLADSASIVVPAGASDPNAANNSAGVYNAITSANGSACSVNGDCASGVCDSASGTCIPVGGCGADSDCPSGQWCNTAIFTCVPQIVNGAAIPTVSGHTPALTGACSPAVATAVCVSGVCDTDNDCGLNAADGPCTVATGPMVCRSGSCSVDGTCEPMGGCEVDADCLAGNWCNEATSVCTAQIPNGGAIPIDAAHTGPTLSGLCTMAAAALVCQSGVCDADNLCGYANGDGSCSVANGGTVCRSGACDPTDLACGYLNGDGPCTNNAGVCRSNACDTDGNCGYAIGDGPCTPATEAALCRSLICASSGPLGGTCEQCASDGDCPGATPACATATSTCVACTATNGSACGGNIPVCNTATETCASCNGDDGSGGTLACPTSDSPYCATAGSCGRCGANSDCVGTHTGAICNLSTGACGALCAVDSDCSTSQWCAGGSCSPKLANGQSVPGASPINGVCTSTNGARVCLSGVCDTDNKCGYITGDGPCTGAPVCRSGICPITGVNVGTCEQCASDGDCSGTTPACDPGSSLCVQCTASNGNACLGTTPVCNPATEICTACASDNGSASPGACPSVLAPFCATTGACGKCTTSSDCSGAHAGPVCDSASGACGTACQADADCTTTQWCSPVTSGNGACVSKLANGAPLPTAAGTCTATSGARVCASGVCDTTGNECGLQNGHGPCASGTVCVSGICVDDACAATAPVDAGAVDGGRADAGKDAGSDGRVVDSGMRDAAKDADVEEPTPDAGRKVEAGDGQLDAGDGRLDTGVRPMGDASSDGIVVGGGGFSCAASPGSPGEGANVLGLVVGLGLLVVRRRRAA
jgi:uncharacterized repeat protein (TIGR01451 family)